MRRRSYNSGRNNTCNCNCQRGVGEDTVEINGLHWSKNDLYLPMREELPVHFYRCSYLSYDQSIEIANSVGGRLPTKQEVQDLLKLGYTYGAIGYNDGLGGYWTGEDHNLKEKSTKSVFFAWQGWSRIGLEIRPSQISSYNNGAFYFIDGREDLLRLGTNHFYIENSYHLYSDWLITTKLVFD